MLRKLSLFAGLILGIALLASCGRSPSEYFSKGSYFDGAVIAEYKQNTAHGTNDYLTFRFYEKGTYKISFSITPDKGDRHRDKIPQNFTETIEVAPREIIVEQYILPDFLRITITKDGKSESRDFS
ncbi:MAG: hypothetical protein Q7R94_02190 [bacterium]|nr:hypothetical protein [bacterium]